MPVYIVCPHTATCGTSFDVSYPPRARHFQTGTGDGMLIFFSSCCLPSGLVTIRYLSPARRSRPCALPRWLTERPSWDLTAETFSFHLTGNIGEQRAVGRMSSWICAIREMGCRWHALEHRRQTPSYPVLTAKILTRPNRQEMK